MRTTFTAKSNRRVFTIFWKKSEIPLKAPKTRIMFMPETGKLGVSHSMDLYCQALLSSYHVNKLSANQKSFPAHLWIRHVG